MAAPDFWPNGARLAITISLMFESGGEVRPDSGALGPLFPIPMPMEIPDLPTETYFQYGYLEGIPRLLNLFDQYDVKVTSFMVGQAVDRNPEVARQIAQSGHECAAHGQRWVPQYAMSPDEERAFIRASVDSVQRATGQRPIGWNDDVSRDEPFVQSVNDRPFVTLPYTLHLNDLVCYELQGFSTQAFQQMLKDEFDVLYEEGRARPRMMVIACHDRVAGRPARVKALAGFLEYALSNSGVWFARKDEIARWTLDRAA